MNAQACRHHVGGVGLERPRSTVEQGHVPLLGDVERVPERAEQASARFIEGEGLAADRTTEQVDKVGDIAVGPPVLDGSARDS